MTHVRRLSSLFAILITLALGSNAQAVPDMAGQQLLTELKAAKDAKKDPPATTASATAPPGGSASAVASAPGAPATSPATGTKKANGLACANGAECQSGLCEAPKKDAPKVCAAPKAAPPSGGSSSRRITTMQCDGATVRKPGIAMVHGDPIWRSFKDSDAPKAAICKPGEAVVVVGNTNHKVDQQCLDYNRGKAGSDPVTWTSTGGLYAIAANVTQISKEIRAWCVPVDDVITEDKFALLAKLAKELKNVQGIDWDAIRHLLQQAPNFATKDLVLKMIEDAMGPTKRLLALVSAKVDQLEERVDNLEALGVSVDITANGAFTYPLGGGGYLAFALNVPFAKAQWFWRGQVGVGGGMASGQLSPAILAAMSFNRQFGRAAVGLELRSQIYQWEHTRLGLLTAGPRLEVRLGGPDYSKLDPTQVRELNGQRVAEVFWFITVGGGGALTPRSHGYNTGFGIDALTGFGVRLGKRHPVKKNQMGEPVAVLESPDQPIEANGPTPG